MQTSSELSGSTMQTQDQKNIFVGK